MSRLIAVLLLPAIGAVSVAQAQPGAERVTLSAGLKRDYATLKNNVMQAAQKMPETEYSFKPGVSDDLRTYGQLVGHQADHQFATCSTINGVPSPSPPEANEKAARGRSRAELTKALAESFAFCDRAISTLTDQNALEMIQAPTGQIARAGLVAALIAHGHGSSNVMAVYLRAKGIARPW
jgi:hypothetical protein